MPLHKTPNQIIEHLANHLSIAKVTKKQLKHYDGSKTRKRHMKLIREWMEITPFSNKEEALIKQIAERSADTKQILADIINEMLEELVKQRIELPAYSKLLRMAKTARNHVNNACYQSLYQELSDSGKKMIDDLLVLDEKTRTTGWNELKREPKKAKSRAMKAYLQHLQWIQSLVEQVPSLGNISTGRRRQYLLEARALHANKMRELKPIKRYALAIIYIHSQQQRALDNVAILFIKTLQNLQNAAQTKMEEYHLKQVKRTEKLITKFKEVLMAYQTHEKKSERLDAIQSVINDQPAEWLSECEAYLSYAGDNYAPFMLSVFKNYRSRLLACLECLQLRSTTRDQSIVRAIEFILQHRDSRREWLDITGKGKKNVINLGWLTHFWRELITGEKSSKKKIIKIHRRYFELCVLTQVMRELKSGDLYVCQSDKFGDYREQLISWETYHQEIAHYCDLMSFDSSPKAFVNTLKQEFLTLANKVDNHYPDNEYLELTDKGPVIKKHETPERPAEVEKLDALITEKMQEIDILDLLVEAEQWLNLHKYFGPISGFEGKIDNARKRFIATLFCYGCNLGPSQTARSVQGFSRKQVAWLNLKHVTEHQLEKVIEIVVNAYNKFRLPKYWGTGKQVAADGTKWNVYEQNLLSEYHIRYGGYGGIGYYHVSDQYIALFSHFIPCGVYEAIYILDGLIKNESDIQPDTVHGDTQAQNAPVFGLSHLLGIKLMPRIRGMKNLIFFRPDKGKRYQHINALFKEQIDWELIETHYPDMLRIAMSIKAGHITPSTILRRLGTKSLKNRLYFAFRELGRVIRTMFLLHYIHDLELRKMIQSATNKSEEFNQFTKWLFFGNDSIIAEDVGHEQHKIILYNQLVANLAILHTVNGMTRAIGELRSEGYQFSDNVLSHFGPYRTNHLNRLGNYILNIGKVTQPMEYGNNFL